MPKSLTIFILVLGISQWGCRGSQKYPLLDEEIQNTKSLLPLPKKPKISILASELTNADGLAYHPLKNKLIWSETNNQNPLEDRVSLYDFISKNTSPWFTDAKASGGHWALPSGDIVSLEGRHSARILIRSRFNRPGDYQLLADLWDGKRLLSPKDLAVLPDGSIYFTDSLVNYAPSGINPVDFQGVWKLSLNGQLNPVVKTMKEPKGIAFAPDYSTFYVSDSKDNIVKEFRINEWGIITRERLFAENPKQEFPVGGLATDQLGNVYVTGGTFIRIFSAQGELLQQLNIGKPTTDLTFGGPEKTDLFIATPSTILTTKMNIPGH